MKIMILHKIFKNIANQLTDSDILRLQKKCEEFACFKECECTDAYSLLLFLEAQGKIDESNLIYLCALLRQIKRPDLLVHLSIISQVLDNLDPVENYLTKEGGRLIMSTPRNISTSLTHSDLTNVVQTSSGSKVPMSDKVDHSGQNYSASLRKRKLSNKTSKLCSKKKKSSVVMEPKVVDENGIQECESCDIHVRVKALYKDHSSALQSIQSFREEPIEQSFDRFNQTLAVLHARDLGTIVCEAKFSELAFLDAFWRDYVSGALVNTLKGVFITDSLRESAGNDEIGLLVTVDEDEYRLGRLKLLKNLC